ncbi:MAG: hypothetical protein ACQJCO_05340 [cyanobacterium endosymbiont of Rhopalodia sterrenbergii]
MSDINNFQSLEIQQKNMEIMESPISSLKVFQKKKYLVLRYAFDKAE